MGLNRNRHRFSSSLR